MTAKGRRAAPHVNHHIKHCALNDAAELRLRSGDLVMQATQRTLHRFGVIVLYEALTDAEFGKLHLLIALEEKAALVAPDRRLNQPYARQCRIDSFHLS